MADNKIKNRQRPIFLILVFSIPFLILWILAKHIIELLLFGGHTIIQLILLGIIFACLWYFINSWWLKQNNKRRYILVGSVVLLLTSIYYAKMVSLNFIGLDRFRLLADGFAHGQLHLMQKPLPELLAQPDPYYPGIDPHLKLHDASLFNGKYYLYFGPVPAVILVAVNGLFRAGAGSNFLMDLFLSLSALMVFLIIYRIWQRKYQEVSWKVALLCFVTIVWSLPVLWLVGRPDVYEVAISGGQAFLLTGFYLLLLAFDEARKQNLLLIGAASALGLAVGVRWNLALPVILLSIMVLVLLVKLRRQESAASLNSVQSGTPHRKPLGLAPSSPDRSLGLSGARVRPISQKKLSSKPLLAFFLPIVLFVIIYGYYNFARFGSPFELGAQYQLTGQEVRNLKKISLANIENNLIRYWVMPPNDLRFQYPFITFAGVGNQDVLPIYRVYGITPHPQIGYAGFEPLSAIFWIAPLSLAGLYPVFGLIRNFQRFRRSRATRSSFADWLGHKDQLYSAFLMLSAFGCFIPLLFVPGSTMRYLMDYFPSLGILSAIGIFKIFTLKSIFPYRVFVKTLLIFLAVYTVLLGVIASITSCLCTFASVAPEVVKSLNAFTKIFTGVFGR